MVIFADPLASQMFFTADPLMGPPSAQVLAFQRRTAQRLACALCERLGIHGLCLALPKNSGFFNRLLMLIYCGVDLYVYVYIYMFLCILLSCLEG